MTPKKSTQHSSETEIEHKTEKVRDLEQNGGSVRAEKTTEVDTKKKLDVEERYVEKIHKGHVGSVLFVCTLFIVGVAAIFLAAPMVVLINNKEQLTNDLNDGLYAYYTYSNKILGGQLSGNCSEDTIRCKFTTLSPMLKERFERYGFTVTGNEGDNGRYNGATLVAPGGGGIAVDATTLNNLRKKSPDINTLVDKVYSSRNGLYQDRQFYERLLTRFGLVQDNTLGGSTEEAFKKSFDERIEQGDPRYVDPNEDPATAARNSQQPQDDIDENARGIYGLTSLKGQLGEWPKDIYPNLIGKANTHLALACAFSTYGNLAENSLRRAKWVTTARFAMNYLAVADDIKSIADRTDNHIAAEYMASSLMQPSSGKSAMDASSYRTPALGESVKDMAEVLMQLSPEAELLFLRAFGFGPSVPGSTYLQGALTNNIVSTSASDRSASGLCAQGMAGAQISTERGGACYSPASMPLASYIGAIAAGVVGPMKDPIEQVMCPFAYPSVVALVKTATTPEASATIPTLLRVASTSAEQKFTSDVEGVKAQNIIFAGAGAILGDRAQSLGMQPANVLNYTEYYAAARLAREEVDVLERQVARTTPWDATNPHAFLGSIVAKLAPYNSTLVGSSWHASAGALFGSITKSFGVLANTTADALYTQPMHFQPSRLLPTNSIACGLGPEMSVLISLDFACNTRYSMSLAELNLSIDDILNYMSEAHPENAQETLSQVQGRDTGADSGRGARMKSEAEEGANAAYIDETGKPNPHTEYAKFLEYCANRYDPWSAVGMAVEYQDERYTEDLVVKDRRVSHGKSLLREQNEEEERPDSYYGLGWGGAADQDWYTGKKCTDDTSEMMRYFRGYTMACGVLAGMSGSRQCWHEDTIPDSHDDFYTSNNIIFKASS